MAAPSPRVVLLVAASAALAAASPASAAPVLRHQELLSGDFTIIGNTLAHDCDNGSASPVVGTVGSCGANGGDSGADILWQSNPAGGTASASTGITPASARSTAVLDAISLPTTATVTYARLYWAATMGATNAYGATATLTTPDDVAHPVTADPAASRVIYTGSATYGYWYQSSADVTALVQARGRYTVSGVAARNLVDLNSNVAFDAWWIVVFYSDPNETALRQVTLFDGLDYVQSGAPADVTLGGFLVPSGGWDAKLGVVTYEGDGSITGDALSFQGYKSTGAEPATLTVLSDAQNPANDFFNRSRSWLGAARSVVGDLPRYSGVDGSMQGVDLDVVDLKASGAINGGDDSAKIRASSTGDVFALGAFITSINTLKPSFLETIKTATNLDRADGVFAGDHIEYVISTRNTGNDPSIKTVLVDALPVGVTYVPGSLERRENGGSFAQLTDAAGDDQAEYVSSTRTVVVRLGAGADPWLGGTVAIGGSAEVRFQVTVNPGAAGVIQNRAAVNAQGLNGEPARDFQSNPPTGTGSTDLPVDQCLSDVHCGGSTPACWTAPMPNVCVGCLNDSYCAGTPATPICEPTAHACVARVTLTPATQEKTTVEGVPAPFDLTLTSHLGSSDTFDLAVASCGWDVQLVDSVGAVRASRVGNGPWAGEDKNGDGRPDLEPTSAGGGTTPFVLRVTPPAGTVAGTTCDVALAAVGQASLLGGIAAAVLHVGEHATWTPDYGGATTRVVPSGEDVAFAGVIQNNTSTALSFDVTNAVTIAPAQGTVQAVTFYSDPDGDGDRVDGEVITSTGPVAAYGGQVHVVAVVHTLTTTGTPLSVGTDLTSTSTATAGAVVARQRAGALVHYVAPYSNPGHTLLASAFTPCDTVYLSATHLPTGYPFALEWYDGGGVRVRNVDPWPVSGGAGTDQLLLPASAQGTWTVRVVQKTPSPTVIDTITFLVERAGIFASLEAPLRISSTGGLSVSASVSSQNGSAILHDTQIAYTVSGSGSFIDGDGVATTVQVLAHLSAPVTVPMGATVADAWALGGPRWPAFGTYQVAAEWQLQCGGVTETIAAATPFSFAVVPGAPTITSPSSGAVLATQEPTFAGTALPNAAVLVTAGASSCATAADGGGAWTCTLGTPLADGAHTATARQTLGAASDDSLAVTFTIDTAPPAVAIAVPTAGALLGAAAAPGGVVAFSGTAETGAPVVVSAGAASAAATRSGGSWTASLTLLDGTYVATATATDAAGNVGAATLTFTLDLTPPGAPVLVPVPDPTRAEPIVVTGSAESGATAELFLDGVSQGTRLSSPAFSFSLAGVSTGAHGVYAVARDPAGNESVASATASFLVDRTPPGLATVDAPADGAVLDAAAAPGGAVTFSGTSELASTVEVEVDGVVLGVVGAPGGTWTVAFALVQGAHQVRVRATDLAGNVGSWSGYTTFSVDSVAPLAPVLDALGTPTSAATVSVTGTVADVGATVGIYVDGAFVGTAAGAGGFSLDLTLGEGSYVLTARALDAAGNRSGASNPVPLTIDRTPPGAPVIDPLVTPTNATSVAVTGTTEAGTTVSIYRNGTFVGTATESGGRFSLDVAVAEGTFTFTATAADAAGNVSPVSSPASVLVDRTPPGAPVLSAVPSPTKVDPIAVAGSAEAGALVELFLDGVSQGTQAAGPAFGFSLSGVAPGPHTLTAVARDAAGNLSPASLPVTFTVDRTPPGLATVDAPLDGALLGAAAAPAGAVPLSGTSEAGSTVEVEVDGVVLGLAGAPSGTWSATHALLDGVHLVRVRATDGAGNVGVWSAASTFTLDTGAPAAPGLDAPAGPTSAATVSLTGVAEPGAIVTVLLDGVFAGTTAAAGDGTFGLTVPVAAEGTHAVTATATDAAGNVSSASPAATVTVDRTAPAAPTLDPLVTPTNAPAVTVGGHAEPGATIGVLVDGAVVGTTVAAGDGSWSVEVPVGDGSHEVTAIATDPAGNGSGVSTAVPVAVDTHVPAAPVLTRPLAGAILGVGVVLVEGSAEAGATVNVVVDGVTYTAVADPGGGFSVATAPLPAGTWTATATAVDAASNRSAPASVTFSTAASAALGHIVGGGCGCGPGAGAPASALLLVAFALVLAPRRRARAVAAVRERR